MGLLRAVYEDAVGEGGGKRRSTNRIRIGASGRLEEDELEEGRMGIERSTSTTRTEDDAFPTTPLDGEELMVLGGGKKTEESELGMERRSWAGGGTDCELGRERVEFGMSFDGREGVVETQGECATEKGDPVEVVFEEGEIELRSLEKDGVGSLWV